MELWVSISIGVAIGAGAIFLVSGLVSGVIKALLPYFK